MTADAPMMKVNAARAVEVCGRFELAKEARPLLRPESAPHEFLAALRSARQHQTAVCFLAHALPPREAVWWGSLCLAKACGSGLAPAEAAATKAAATWVLEPSEENRQAAETAAQAAERGTPAELLARAVAWTGGSLAPPLPKVPPVPPPPHLAAKGVFGAVLLAATRNASGDVQESLRLFADLGAGVAEGRFTWPDVKPRRTGTTWGF